MNPLDRGNTYRLIWDPTGQQIAEVRAMNETSARNKAPSPYKKFKGEIRVEFVCTGAKRG